MGCPTKTWLRLPILPSPHEWGHKRIFFLVEHVKSHILRDIAIFSNNVIVKQEEDKGHWDELRQWLTNKILKNYHIGIFLNNVLVLFKSSLVIIRCYCHLDYQILSDYQRSSYYCVSSVKNHRGSLSARRCDFWLLSCFAFVFPGWWPNWTSHFLHFCICCHTTLPQIDWYHQNTKVHHARHN